MNKITIENKGEIIKYKGQYKGWLHQKSVYCVVLYRGDIEVERHETNKNKSASVKNHLISALGDNVTFKKVKHSKGVFLTKCKIKGFSGWHIIELELNENDQNFHIDCLNLDLDSSISEARRLMVEKYAKISAIEAEKIKNLQKKWSLLRVVEKFGFCKIGIEKFCNAIALDSEQSYSSREILDAIAKNNKTPTFCNILCEFHNESISFISHIEKIQKKIDKIACK